MRIFFIVAEVKK